MNGNLVYVCTTSHFSKEFFIFDLLQFRFKSLNEQVGLTSIQLIVMRAKGKVLRKRVLK